MATAYYLARGNTKLVMVVIFMAITMVSCRQSEQAQTLVKTNNLVGNGARLPRLASLPNGEVLMSWVEPVGEQHALKFAKLNNGHIVSHGEVATGANWFINWADFPSVVPITESFWLSHRLVKQVGGKPYDYDIVLSLSNDAGFTWRDIGSPHRDKTAAEHGFAAIFSEGAAAGIIWLDGREYVDKKDAAKYPNKSGNFELRYTRVQRDGTIETEQVIDSNTCTCCWPSVAVTSVGAIATWRGRTNQEVRDNQISLLGDGKWAAPQPLGSEGWTIDGCPVNGPAVAARGMQVVAAWFSAEGDRPRVRAAFSKDGGKSFSQPIDIDAAAPLGRIGLVWRDDSTAVISWITSADRAGKQAGLALRTVSTDGEMGEIKHIAKISTGHDTGVPQMAAVELGVLLAWTNAESTHGIKTAIVPWADLTKQNLLQKVSASWHMLTLHTHYKTKPADFLASVCVSPH
jgi:hypothetical protein